jgi:hypothetical protein
MKSIEVGPAEIRGEEVKPFGSTVFTQDTQAS